MPLRENKAGAARICSARRLAHFVRGRAYLAPVRILWGEGGRGALRFLRVNVVPCARAHLCGGGGDEGRAFLHSDSAALIAADADAEEERRLFYVGMTRAKDELILTTSGAPSPFLSDLPADVRREKAQPRPVWRQLSLF